jgi:putative endonuclease
MADPRRAVRGARAWTRGAAAEQVACDALSAEGWEVLARRLRTGAGEIDIVARRGDLVAFVEVKARPSLAGAAWALTPRQQRRIMEAAAAALAQHPEWHAGSLRFDVFLVDEAGRVRRIANALRAE